jgi:ATP-dependent exoDNAse (exonuclease V) alpha subunit
MEGEGGRKGKDLENELEMAIGMKVIITENMETDLDVANGSRGIIINIVLDADEPPIPDTPVVRLKMPPTYILVKLDRTRATRLEGLEERTIPLEPSMAKYRIKLATGTKMVTRTITRRQFSITPAYAFTDYRSQGQTIPYVIVDIAKLPSGTLSLFNLYVALSRSSGRGTIRLLREFEDSTFQKVHDLALLAEDDRLEELNRATKKRYERAETDSHVMR